jgi:hypothetical protein
MLKYIPTLKDIDFEAIYMRMNEMVKIKIMIGFRRSKKI